MGKFLERLKRSKDKLKSRFAATREKREIQGAIRAQKQEGKRTERERKEQVRSGFAKIAEKREGKEREKREIQREKAFEQRAEKLEKKELTIAKVRVAQLKRAKAEAGIFKARAQRVKAVRDIRKPLPTLNIGGPVVQRTSAPVSVTGFGLTKKKQKKKRPMGFSQQPTPGLGRFRVL